MANYAVKDLKQGMVVWESCSQGNARLTVLADAVLTDGYWSARCQLDSGVETSVGHTDNPEGSAYGPRLYDRPMYSGVRWVCDPDNIPEEDMQREVEARKAWGVHTHVDPGASLKTLEALGVLVTKAYEAAERGEI